MSCHLLECLVITKTDTFIFCHLPVYDLLKQKSLPALGLKLFLVLLIPEGLSVCGSSGQKGEG